MSRVLNILSTLTGPEFSDLVQRQFSHLNAMPKSDSERLFISEDLTNHGSETKRYIEIDVETFADLKRQAEGARIASAMIGYEKTVRAKRYAKEILMAWEFQRYQMDYATKAASEMQSLMHFIPMREELNRNHVFTFSTSASYTDRDGETIDMTTGDGLSLANAAHTLSNSSVTYRNRLAGDPLFSTGSLALMENIFSYEIYSNAGELRQLFPNFIFSTRDGATRKDIRQTLESTAGVDAAHSGVMNYYSGAYTHITLPYLDTTATGAVDSTKRRWWGLVAQYQNPANSWQGYFCRFENNNAKVGGFGTNGEDFSRDVAKIGVRGSHAIALVSPKGFAIACPTS